MAGLNQLSLGSGNNLIVFLSLGLMSTIAPERDSGKEAMPIMSKQWIIIGSEEKYRRIYFCALRPNKGCPAP